MVEGVPDVRTTASKVVHRTVEMWPEEGEVWPGEGEVLLSSLSSPETVLAREGGTTLEEQLALPGHRVQPSGGGIRMRGCGCPAPHYVTGSSL